MRGPDAGHGTPIASVMTSMIDGVIDGVIDGMIDGVVAARHAVGMSLLVTRLAETPMIHAALNDRMNRPDIVNINGPSVVRMPDWAPGRLGTYHMYFGHHKGHYIRLAYADDLAGPWQVYDPGVLDLADSLFEPVNPTPSPDAVPPYWADDLGEYLYAHIASPDVHIDHDARCLHMYYHGLLYDGDQQTRYAVSRDGLHFSPQAPLLGGPYFRAITWDGMIYAIDWDGAMYRAPQWAGPFTRLPWGVPAHMSRTGRDDDGVLHRMRHPHLYVHQGRIHMCFTRIGDAPEALFHAELFPPPSAANTDAAWQFGPVREILRAAPGWEGGDLPVAPSAIGTAMGRVNQLRDPVLFAAKERLYLAYCGGGESGIGIASVTGL